jgi:GTP-binding protein
MFIDRVKVKVKAGKGGDGCISFRREKFVPRGGPDGGSGGHGGDVIFRVDPHMRTLLDLYYRKSYKAEPGGHGQGKNMTGRNGAPVIVKVPPGTVIEDAATNEAIADLDEPGEEAVVARGGKGGRGNYSFRNPRIQAPRRRTLGEPGGERELRLTLKLIADVGLVGLPNAGKSTLLRAVSDAHPVVAPYPFSTVEPVLGMVKIDAGASFCMIDIPGLIEGAHAGRGLGIQFLRHVERCRVLLFILDAAGDIPPQKAYEQLAEELRLYSGALIEKPRLIALNKTDLLPKGPRASGFKPRAGEQVFKISALERTGIRPLIAAAYRLVTQGLTTDPIKRMSPVSLSRIAKKKG